MFGYRAPKVAPRNRNIAGRAGIPAMGISWVAARARVFAAKSLIDAVSTGIDGSSIAHHCSGARQQ
jgi:hypothetical protein